MNTDMRFLATPALQNATPNGLPPVRKSVALHLDALPQLLAARASSGRYTLHMAKPGEPIVRCKLLNVESAVAVFQKPNADTPG